MALLPKQYQKLTPELPNIRKTQANWVVIQDGFTIGPGWSWTINAVIKHVHDALGKKGVSGRYLDRWRPLDNDLGETVIFSDGHVFNGDLTANDVIDVLRVDKAIREVRDVNSTGRATSVQN
jgi:hypothetical protein